jgi:hypothetical protein
MSKYNEMPKKVTSIEASKRAHANNKYQNHKISNNLSNNNSSSIIAEMHY